MLRVSSVIKRMYDDYEETVKLGSFNCEWYEIFPQCYDVTSVVILGLLYRVGQKSDTPINYSTST